jgi:hypothetical protein
MTARHATTAPLSDVSIDGRDDMPDGDGFNFDNADSFRCWASNFKGAGAVLSRTSQPQWNHPDMPVCAYFSAQHCGDGIKVNAVDWKIDSARIDGMKGHGIDVWQGNLREHDSKVYGVDIAYRVRPGVALCSFVGSEGSDARVGYLIQGNETTLSNIFSEHVNRGVIVGAKSLLSSLRINSDRDILSQRPNRKPSVAIEFANRTDPEFGPLCANWSTLIGAHFDVLPGDTAVLVNAHMLTLTGLHVNGEADAIALLVNQPVDNLTLEMTVSGPAILIRQLGSNCNINLRFHQSRPRIELPDNWNPTNHIYVNGVEQKSK